MIVLIGAEKGGVGKSTIAVNMAAVRAAQGRDVLLIDTDIQGSSRDWASYRTSEKREPGISCVALSGKTVSDEIRSLARRYDDIVVDAGGKDSVELRAAMLVAELLITPSMPSQFDLSSLMKMDRLVGEARAFNTKLRAVILVNGAPTNSRSTEASEMLAFVEEMQNYEIFQTIVKARKAYRMCAREGVAAPELLKKDSQATEEMMSLAAEVWR